MYSLPNFIRAVKSQRVRRGESCGLYRRNERSIQNLKREICNEEEITWDRLAQIGKWY